MKNLSQHIIEEKKRKRSALYMPYLTLGDPSFEESFIVAKAMIDAGSSLLELGIPFSDPTADGPLIQKAMVRSMNQKNFSLEKIFELTQKIHNYAPEIPLVYLTYFNPIFQYKKSQNAFLGEAFLKKAYELGIRALVIPDLPLDSPEAEELQKNIHSLEIDIALIPMIAPNTKFKRAKKILEKGSGFVYYITSLGVTGIREELPDDFIERISLLQSLTNLPIFAGFGISKTEQVEKLKNLFDGIIVGSLNHKIIEELIESQRLDMLYQQIFQITKNFVDHLSLNGNI
ncbi:MAG: tryptophan synthase subunit alpha [Leptospiraceae bacterium]|nr:tryptophan synthase subunit alpha [Leptospiraceae bacterium]MDW7975422.1 tryptophan synthase subunit alpha [Leptospiraceae bacterium]